MTLLKIHNFYHCNAMNFTSSLHLTEMSLNSAFSLYVGCTSTSDVICGATETNKSGILYSIYQQFKHLCL